MGDLAYVADGASGLRVIDVSNPAFPVEHRRPRHAGLRLRTSRSSASSPTWPTAAFGLRVIDVSNPAAPVEIGALDTPGYAYDVEVVGELAYVADRDSGLRVIDVSNPAAPVEIGSPRHAGQRLATSRSSASSPTWPTSTPVCG